MAAELGEDKARRILGAAIRRNAIEQGRTLGGGGGGAGRHRRVREAAGALGRPTTRCASRSWSRTTSVSTLNVTRCRYSEMYRDLGLGDLGAVLSCNRDGAFCEGYDPRLELTRTQTIMSGASHCNFRYRWREQGED